MQSQDLFNQSSRFESHPKASRNRGLQFMSDEQDHILRQRQLLATQSPLPSMRPRTSRTRVCKISVRNGMGFPRDFQHQRNINNNSFLMNSCKRESDRHFIAFCSTQSGQHSSARANLEQAVPTAGVSAAIANPFEHSCSCRISAFLVQREEAVYEERATSSSQQHPQSQGLLHLEPGTPQQTADRTAARENAPTRSRAPLSPAATAGNSMRGPSQRRDAQRSSSAIEGSARPSLPAFARSSELGIVQGQNIRLESIEAKFGELITKTDSLQNAITTVGDNICNVLQGLRRDSDSQTEKLLNSEKELLKNIHHAISIGFKDSAGNSALSDERPQNDA